MEKIHESEKYVSFECLAFNTLRKITFSKDALSRNFFALCCEKLFRTGKKLRRIFSKQYSAICPYMSNADYSKNKFFSERFWGFPTSGHREEQKTLILC